MKKTGQHLKQKRESSGLSLSEVALATKINPKVLTAIESGDERNLPAKTFLKGFVRSYALFLRTDVDEVLKLFVEETGGPAPVPQHEAYQKDAPTSRAEVQNEGSSSLRTAAIVVIVALICAIIGVRELVDKYQRERIAARTPADVKVSPLAEGRPVPMGEVAEAKNKGTAPAVNVPAITVPAAPLFTARLAEPERPFLMSMDSGIPKALEQPAAPVPRPVEVAVQNIPEPAVVKDVAPTAVAPAAETPREPAQAETPAAAPSTVANEVIIEALDRVQVRVQLASVQRTIDLAPNEVHVVRTGGPIALDVSDGGAVSLVLNGRVRGVAGKLGEPKQVKFP